MKTRHLLVFLNLLIFNTFSGYTQTITSLISYDTTVTGTGSMNPPYEFSFPKFDNSLGTLAEVRIASVLTLSYSFTIENKDPGSKTSKISINRMDEITSSLLPVSDPVDYYYAGPLNTYNLGAADGIPGSGADFHYQPPSYIVNEDTIIKKTVYNTAQYMGAGNVTFNYSTDVGSATFGNLNVAFLGQATDQIKMSITYVYITSNISLATDITSFTANKNKETVSLNWHTRNEQGNRTYELLKSTDGKNFTPVKKFNALPDGNQSGTYEYNYTPEKNETGKIFFQVKLIEPDGPIKYSPLRSVDFGNTSATTGIRLFPNPVKGGETTIVFNQRGTWDIQLFNLKGQLIRQMQVANALQFKINANNQLPAGNYFVVAINRKTNEKAVERLIVQ